MDRRSFLKRTAGVIALSMSPKAVLAAPDLPQKNLATSALIYISPLRSDNRPSRCQAEVWFVQDGAEILVVSSSYAWRVQAIEKGLDKARIWIGEAGVWSKSNGRYKKFPTVDVQGVIENDHDAQQVALEAYKDKYRGAWLFWKRRFRNGLADGTRTMLRYQVL